MAAKATLHWFTRAVITMVVAGVWNLLVMVGSLVLLDTGTGFQDLAPGLIVAAMIPLTTLPSLAIYGTLTKYLGPPAPDGELRCCKCGYILRGLSEPRCPECGEAI